MTLAAEPGAPSGQRKPKILCPRSFGGPTTSVQRVDDEALAVACEEVADAVAEAISRVEDPSAPGTRPGQYALDLVADSAALEVLDVLGVGVISEESGVARPGAELVAVLDPLDGSTNASRGIPWFATSVCIVDAEGPRVALVANQANGVRYRARRAGGALRDGAPIAPTGCSDLADAIVGLSGYPSADLGWAQFRSLGAASLDMCCVADGTLDAYAVVGSSTLGCWDYMGAMLVCAEAGAVTADALGESAGKGLVDLDHGARHAPLAAATDALRRELGTALALMRRGPARQAVEESNGTDSSRTTG